MQLTLRPSDTHPNPQNSCKRHSVLMYTPQHAQVNLKQPSQQATLMVWLRRGVVLVAQRLWQYITAAECKAT
jgi:hypothetical protein